MGIDKKRFISNVEISIDKFLCGICHDVVSDPILTSGCEHYFCRQCVTVNFKICPTCGTECEGFINVGSALKRIYSNIKIKCIYASCDAILTLENYIQHERKCPQGFYECPYDCGFKLRLSLDEEQRKHSCIEVLKSKIFALEKQNAQLQTDNDTLQKMNENIDLLSTVGAYKKRRGNWSLYPKTII